jgi:2-keto-3-deoxy-L-rhamnonate aldolase RhmA
MMSAMGVSVADEHARPLGLRARLHSPARLFNAVLSVPEAAIATILGYSGFDFVVIDAEHGPFTLDTIRACVEALEPTPAAVVVRASGGHEQLLDLGVDGIQAPNVESAQQASQVVRSARYPPAGSRGVGLGRASRYGMNLSEYLSTANDSIAVLAMIESAAGVLAAGEIAALEGIDGIVVGLMDLSADLGVIGQLEHPSVTHALSEVASAAGEYRVKVGTGCRPEQVAALADVGLELFTCFIDANALAAAARDALRLAAGHGMPG